MGLGHNDPWVESPHRYGVKGHLGVNDLWFKFLEKRVSVSTYFDVVSNLILQWLQKYVIAKAGETRGSRTALCHVCSSSSYRVHIHVRHLTGWAKTGRKRKRMSNTRVHPLSWLLSNNRLEKVPFVSVPHTSSNRLLLSNQDKGYTPSVAHSLALPLGPALLNLWTVFQSKQTQFLLCRWIQQDLQPYMESRGGTQLWVGHGCAARSFEHHPITKPEKARICNL